MGQLIIIEGGDGSGKATQTAKLLERLQAEGYQARSVSFPNYDSPAAEPIKMYLRGDFGKEASSVNAYVASTLYAIDRFASYRQDWQRFYEDGGIIIADRYTTSNMVHQMIKYTDLEERKTFLQWLDQLEYDLYGLPRPDAVILLDMPLSLSEALLAERTGKTGGNTGDIHEQDRSHLIAVHDAYDMLVSTYDWHRVHCENENDQLRTIDDIHEEVYEIVKQCINSHNML